MYIFIIYIVAKNMLECIIFQTQREKKGTIADFNDN